MTILLKLHNWASIVIVFPLLLTVSTGVLYQILHLWFSVPQHKINVLLQLHQLSILGSIFKFFYAPLLMFLVGFMGITGLYMFISGFRQIPLKLLSCNQVRYIHHNVAMLLLLPLIWMALWGGTYRILSSWFGIDRHWLLDVHQFKVGLKLEYIVPVLVGLATIVLGILGIPMNYIFVKIFRKSNYQQLPVKDETEEFIKAV